MHASTGCNTTKIVGPEAKEKITYYWQLKLTDMPSTLFSAFLFVSSHSTFIIMLSIIWYLLLPRTFVPFTIPSRASFSRQFLLSQCRSQFLFSSLSVPALFFLVPLYQTLQHFFILSVHFTRSILLHTQISNASSCFCSFHRSFQVWLQLSWYKADPGGTLVTCPPMDPRDVVLNPAQTGVI